MEQPKPRHPEVPENYKKENPDTKDRAIEKFYKEEDQNKRKEVIAETEEIISLNTVYNWLNPMRMRSLLKDNMALSEVYKHMEDRRAQLEESGATEEADIIEVILDRVNRLFPDDTIKLAEALVGIKDRRTKLAQSIHKNQKYLPD